MEQTLTLKDVVNLLELGKKRAELAFRIEISKDEEKAQYIERLQSIQGNLNVLSGRVEKAGIVIPTPFESEIATLNESLSQMSASQIHEAMKKREGELFEKLAQRGAITKRNFENRENIAKLSLLLPKIEKDVCEKILDAIKRGSIQDAIPMLNTNQEISNKIAALLGRLGLKCKIEEASLLASQEANEVEVIIQNKKVWVASGLHEKINKNKESLYNISSKIQLKNAVRQIKEFSEEEEKEFSDMQNEYLKLLKEQDVLLKDFMDEEKMFLSD